MVGCIERFGRLFGYKLYKTAVLIDLACEAIITGMKSTYAIAVVATDCAMGTIVNAGLKADVALCVGAHVNAGIGLPIRSCFQLNFEIGEG